MHPTPSNDSNLEHAGQLAEESWFEKPANVNRLIMLLIVACALTVAAQLFYTNDHPHFDWENIFGFQALFGFIAFVVIVFLGWFLRLFVRREEDYYDQ